MCDPSQTAETIYCVEKEIDRSHGSRSKTLRTATFLGMTTDEAQE